MRKPRRRGNSTYLVDRVMPMLPEALSNELCSLKPQVERLTKCVEFLLSSEGASAEVAVLPRRDPFPAPLQLQGGVRHCSSAARWIRSSKCSTTRMQLAQKIRRARFKAGSLDLDFPETKIRLDERGRVLRMEKVENDISHQLIEEFMLLANEAVAGRLMSLNRPAVYRIHEPPDDRRLQEYREDVLSHHIQCGNLLQPP